MSLETKSTPNLFDPTDGELDDFLVDFLRQHARAWMKAIVIGLMVGFSVIVFSGSIFKGFLIGALCLLVAGFNTWRRYLEPLTFWIFIAAVIYWCDQEILHRLRIGALALYHLIPNVA
jgi:hypothetical protein